MPKLCEKCGIRYAQGCRCNLGTLCEICGPHSTDSMDDILKRVGEAGAKAILDQIDKEILEKWRAK